MLTFSYRSVLSPSAALTPFTGADSSRANAFSEVILPNTTTLWGKGGYQGFKHMHLRGHKHSTLRQTLLFLLCLSILSIQSEARDHNFIKSHGCAMKTQDPHSKMVLDDGLPAHRPESRNLLWLQSTTQSSPTDAVQAP